MARPTHSSQLDTDGLQADVMRFMAIIAFCLIAILALVKNLEPPALSQQEVHAPQIDEQFISAEHASVPVRENWSPTTAAILEVEETAAVKLEPSAIPEPSHIPDKKARESRLFTKEAIVNVAASQENPVVTAPNEPVVNTPEETTPSIKAVSKATDTKEPQKPEEPEEVEKPLRLRFSSDADFLSLIAGNGIQLYGLRESTFISMGSDFKTGAVQPSGELYEILAGSIPDKITHIFAQDAAAITYLVALGNETRNELNQLIKQINNTDSQGTNGLHKGMGNLVIHRDGHVHHETRKSP